MAEFEEISHTGGQVTIEKRADGVYQLGALHCSPHAMRMLQIAVGFDGRILGVVPFGGLDQSENGKVQRRPYFMAFLFSDREGLFGRTCPACRQYFRTTPIGMNESWCPYCTYRGTSLAFLTKNQLKYLETFVNAIVDAPEGETTFNLDELIDALPANRSTWVYAEERQQTRFTCECEAESDVLACGKRTNGVIVNQKLDRLVAMIDDIEALPEGAVRSSRIEDALVTCVAVFEGTGNDIRRQLTRLPMTPRRRQNVAELNFQDVVVTANSLRHWFAIELFRDVSPDDQKYVSVMFQRRHLISHTAGRVSEKYLKRTSDTSVRLNQRIRVDRAEVRRLLPLVRQIATNLLADFESIGPDVPRA